MLKWIAFGVLALAATCQNPQTAGTPVEEEAATQQSGQADASDAVTASANTDEMSAGAGDAGATTNGEAGTDAAAANDTGITGLVEREPDLCHAADYQQYLGQPRDVIDTLEIDRTYRVIEYGAIATQEYNGRRINFRLDAEGNIARIDCG